MLVKDCLLMTLAPDLTGDFASCLMLVVFNGDVTSVGFGWFLFFDPLINFPIERRFEILSHEHYKLNKEKVGYGHFASLRGLHFSNLCEVLEFWDVEKMPKHLLYQFLALDF